jgi:hypothetical protein
MNKTTHCSICGCKIDLSTIAGFDGQIYIKIQDIWIRCKSLDRLFMICESCILKMKVLKEE